MCLGTRVWITAQRGRKHNTEKIYTHGCVEKSKKAFSTSELRNRTKMLSTHVHSSFVVSAEKNFKTSYHSVHNSMAKDQIVISLRAKCPQWSKYVSRFYRPIYLCSKVCFSMFLYVSLCFSNKKQARNKQETQTNKTQRTCVDEWMVCLVCVGVHRCLLLRIHRHVCKHKKPKNHCGHSFSAVDHIKYTLAPPKGRERVKKKHAHITCPKFWHLSPDPNLYPCALTLHSWVAQNILSMHPSTLMNSCHFDVN